LHANRALTLTDASGLQAASGAILTYVGDIAGASNTLTINGDSQTGTVVLGGNNTYGNTILSGGAARIAANTALGNAGTISFAGGTLQYSSAYTADHSARFSNAANQAYAIDTNGETVTLATALTSSGGTFVKTGTGLNRRGMKIVVRDLTNVESASVADKNLHVKQLERQLIKEYTDIHNALPIGNVKDESYIDNKTCVTKSTWHRLFEFE
jgi:hypothetical protein